MSKDSAREEALHRRSRTLARGKLLQDARVYLSGPMDFVASRSWERENGWRARIHGFLDGLGTRIFDPWNKPQVVGMPHYGKEDEFTADKRNDWTYVGDDAEKTRAEVAAEFWPTLHIDLRMVDISDFLIAYCPTNVYSVGTVHEIVMARLQHKPVLFVSPRLDVGSLEKLEAHLEERGDEAGKGLLDELVRENPIKPNPEGIPSLWYMALVDPHYFFDGFGWDLYRDEFGWPEGPMDRRERRLGVKRPLLRYLRELSRGIPMRYDLEREAEVENEDWLIFQAD